MAGCDPFLYEAILPVNTQRSPGAVENQGLKQMCPTNGVKLDLLISFPVTSNRRKKSLNFGLNFLFFILPHHFLSNISYLILHFMFSTFIE